MEYLERIKSKHLQLFKVLEDEQRIKRTTMQLIESFE